jgi:phosphoserine phosphatase
MSNQTDNQIDNIIQNTPPGLAIFDFDNTLIRGDLGDTLLYHIISNFLINVSEQFLKAFQTSYTPNSLLTAAENIVDENHKVCRLYRKWHSAKSELMKSSKRLQLSDIIDSDFQKICFTAFKEYIKILKKFGGTYAYPWSSVFYSGFSTENLIKISSQVIRNKAYHVNKAININGIFLSVGYEILDTMRKFIVKLHNSGFRVKIVSASPQELIQTFFQLNMNFSLGKDDIVGLKIRKTVEKNLYDIQALSPITTGHGKVDAIKKFFREIPVITAGDSWSDYEMLNFSSHKAVYIHHGDKKLLKEAHKNSWQIFNQDEL